MKIKKIRKNAGLTQKKFAETYHIPLQTLKQWESNPMSSSHRKPPGYILYMLDRLVKIDYRGEER